MSNGEINELMQRDDDRDVRQAVSSAAMGAAFQLRAQFPGIDLNFEAHLDAVIMEMLKGRSLIQGCEWGAELKPLIVE